jgi:hypothetical protein
MLKLSVILLITAGSLMMYKTAPAQSFGFGCLGLVGGYGGYSYQNLKPAGLNDYILSYNTLRTDSLSSPMSSFGKATGFRVGLNFYRANLDGLILTAKGFYQFVSEKNNAVVESSYGTTNTEFELRMQSWGIGLDLGILVTGRLSWKVLDAALLFSDIEFIDTENFPGAVTTVETYNGDTDVAYSVGTGFILSIVEQYISLEGMVGYLVMDLDRVEKDDGTPLTITENSEVPMENFIKSGGFSAVIQLNVGFPL